MINDHSLVAIKHRTHKFFFFVLLEFFVEIFLALIASSDFVLIAEETTPTSYNSRPLLARKLSAGFKGHRQYSRGGTFSKAIEIYIPFESGRSITSIYSTRFYDEE